MADIYHLLKIEAQPKAVFDAIATMSGITKWWTPQVNGGTEIDDTIRFHFGPEYSKVMHIKRKEPNTFLSWECLEAVDEWVGTTIEFNIEEVEQGTVLHFNHKNWPGYSRMYGQCSYDWAMFLRSLMQYCQTGKGTPFPNQNKINY